MQKVDDLRSGWELEQALAKADKEKRAQKSKVPAVDDLIVPDDAPIEEEEVAPIAAALFEDSDDSDADDQGESEKAAAPEKIGAKSSDKEDETEVAADTTHQDLFGDSGDEESDEELKRSSGKRGADEKDRHDEGTDEPPSKKSKVHEDSD
jgi:hypothetical protein